ncbi:hypothetical protein C4569_02635 [Candidatus Parcubacteria bacterium]|nr:MAG: hypothetical protein C4569_02635 [Candidatus Parcubacteria bacterium]
MKNFLIVSAVRLLMAAIVFIILWLITALCLADSKPELIILWLTSSGISIFILKTFLPKTEKPRFVKSLCLLGPIGLIILIMSFNESLDFDLWLKK